jgi:hypothetical protein
MFKRTGVAYRASSRRNKLKSKIMLYTIAVILIALWLLGLVTGTTIGGFVHVLLVIAVVMILLRIISGKRPVL